MENSLPRCLFCNEEFNPSRPWMKFCSPKCRNNYHNDKKYMKEGEMPSPRCPHCTNKDVKMIEKVYENVYLCEVCAKEFIWEG
jgi:hypothetical protein